MARSARMGEKGGVWGEEMGRKKEERETEKKREPPNDNFWYFADILRTFFWVFWLKTAAALASSATSSTATINSHTHIHSTHQEPMALKYYLLGLAALLEVSAMFDTAPT